MAIFRYLPISPILPHSGAFLWPGQRGNNESTGCMETAFSAASRKMDNADWRRIAFFDGLHRIFPDAFREVAEDLAQAYHMVVYRRMERRGLTFAFPQSSDPKRQSFRSAAVCNINNDHRRNIRQCVAPRAKGDEEASTKHGAAFPTPEAEVMAPHPPEWPESQHRRLRPKRNVNSKFVAEFGISWLFHGCPEYPDA